MSSSTAAAAKSRRRTTKPEFLAVVTFLEKRENFQLIEGGASAGKPMISGQKLSKTEGYKALEAHVNHEISDKARF